ncbi:MAG TPA: amino acid adenylation domain-containing protein, partial [Chloroflexota bacterium]|nr:amino acid adenylation domain-containing protein [Chloroflexota bacterium]
AYLIATSGTTGTPKLVAVEHRSLVNLIEWHRETYGVTDRDRSPLVAAVSFDASVWETWPYLAAGASLHLPDGATRSDPATLIAWLAAARISCAFLPTPLAEAALALPWPERLTLRTLLTGGDRLHAAPPLGIPFTVVNHYGPTEVSVVTTALPMTAGSPGVPPIGRPIANTQCFILDRWLELVPIGVAGELCVGGEGVARGYLGRPELTAQQFVPDPFSAKPGARMYRTGDLVRYGEDGAIEFLGRLDQQVKLRGYRIEPGEIEAALRALPGVAQAAVLLREDRPGERRLVAYVTGRDGMTPDAVALRQHLSKSMPEYMLPSVFEILAALPLNASGKVNRTALPVPTTGDERPAAGVAIRPPVEEMLARIWEDVLGIERAGDDDDFFALGGHSLVATRVVARVRQTFDVELPLRAIFDDSRLGALARRIEQARGAGPSPAPPLLPARRDLPLPLSFAQQRLWFLERLEPGSPRYGIYGGIQLTGELDQAALARALEAIVQRHEVLRTVFEVRGGEPVQVVAPPTQPPLPLRDLRSVLAAERPAEVERLVRDAVALPFDLTHGPLLRLLLLQLADQEHLLLLALHHTIADGWSLGVFCRELSACYSAFQREQPLQMPPLPIQYADYAVWQRNWLQGEALEQQLTYWKRQLADVPAVHLPTDYPRPAVERSHGAVHTFQLPEALTAQLLARCRAEGVTLYMLLLAAFQTLLARYSGQEDVAVGSPLAGRRQTELEGLIGCFVNMLVMRGDLSGDPTFAELLTRVREVTLGAYANQDIPFEHLVEALQPARSLSRNPIFQVVLALQNVPMTPLNLPDLQLSPLTLDLGTAKFDLSAFFTETPQGLAGAMEYNTDLFTPATVARLAQHFTTLLSAVAADPQQRLSQLPLMTEEERQRLLEDWNQTEGAFPRGETVAQLFERQAAQTPLALAVANGTQRLTYSALEERANRLAHWLRARGVGPNVPVAVLLERSVDLVVALLGIVKAGGAYVPLDPGYPPERLGFMLGDCQAPILVTTAPLAEALPFRKCRTLCLDGEETDIARQPAHAPAAGSTSRDLAYIIYTSGSTGRPKGVEITQGGLVNLIAWHHQTYAVTVEDRATQLAGLAFDASVWELWPYLTAGASIHMPDETTRLAPTALVKWLAREQITLCFLPTPLAEAALREPWPPDMPLRALLTGGDRLQRTPEAGMPFVLVNHYGPTEYSVVTTATAVAPDAGPGGPPIGRPIANTRVYVLDRHKRPTPPGIPGELYIGGAGLARGYRGRPDLTAERFVPDPFAKAPGGRLYRTGDLVRWRDDGNLEFLGRLDGQVKVQGFRVELGEVESVLVQHPSVQEASVVTREFAPGDTRLVAYVVSKAGHTFDSPELQRCLKERLPTSMLPAAIVSLATLPLTPNGKVDRQALPEPSGARPDLSAPFEAPRSELEEGIANIWRAVLQVESVGRHDNFFDLGGRSLLLVQIHSRLEETLGQEIALVDLFHYPTISTLAGRLSDRSESEEVLTGITERASAQRAAFSRGNPLARRQERQR